MFRFFKVKGVSGVLVAHPNGDPTRYLGQMPAQNPPRWGTLLEHPALSEMYEPCEEVVKDDSDGHIRTAIAKGELLKVDMRPARTMGEAMKAMEGSTLTRPAITHSKKGD